MTEVASFPFEEIGVEIDGIHCGFFSGTAHIDEDGEVLSLDIDGYQGDDKSFVSISVTGERNPLSFRDSIAFAVADTITANCKASITDALIDYSEDRHVREYEAA